MALKVSKDAHKDIRIVQDFISCIMQELPSVTFANVLCFSMIEKHNTFAKVTDVVAKYLELAFYFSHVGSLRIRKHFLFFIKFTELRGYQEKLLVSDVLNTN